MKIIFISIFLIVTASTEPHPDKKCFIDHVNNLAKPTNETFEIRIEHAGSLFDIADWFNNGELYTINSTNLDYDTTAKAMDEVCAAFGDTWCTQSIKNQLYKIGNETRVLTVGYNGVEVYAGMAIMNITLTNTNATSSFVECLFIHQNASLTMNPMEFSYTNWDTSKMNDNIPWKPQDKLFVHGG